MFDDRSPIYQQIAEKIKDEILSGALRDDDQVMSTNQYATFYRINPATAAKAFQQLVDEGVLYKKRGIGMFVSTQAHEQLRGQRRKRFFAEVVDAMVAEARMIGIPLAEVVRHLEAAPDRVDDSSAAPARAVQARAAQAPVPPAPAVQTPAPRDDKSEESQR